MKIESPSAFPIAPVLLPNPSISQDSDHSCNQSHLFPVNEPLTLVMISQCVSIGLCLSWDCSLHYSIWGGGDSRVAVDYLMTYVVHIVGGVTLGPMSALYLLPIGIKGTLCLLAPTHLPGLEHMGTLPQ